jgi:twitching motility protein PilJ
MTKSFSEANSLPDAVNPATDATSHQGASAQEPQVRKRELSDQRQRATSVSTRSSLLQSFRDLPINKKQLLGLMTSEAISVIGLVGVGVWLIIAGGRAQLLNQAKSELVVTETNYNIKVNQMGLGFRGQSDNAAVIEAARTHQQGRSLETDLKQRVRSALQNEIKAREIEYATLVGTDLKIIVNANADRQGEAFDPQGLVSQVLKDPKQIKTSEIISWEELRKEAPPLPAGFSGKDALIRYTVTPVKQPETGRVIGALVSGDIVNGKEPIVRNTVESFGSGYSAIYLRQSDGRFELATALEKQPDNDQVSRSALTDNALLETAIAAKGQPAADRVSIGGQTYTVAAKTLNNFANQPVAVLVRGTSEATLNQMLQERLTLQLIVAGASILAGIWLASVLSRSIVGPLQKLRQTAQEFSDGNLAARVPVESSDEVGQLSHTFNQMAERLAFTLQEVQEQERRLSDESQGMEDARQQALTAWREAERLAQEQQEQRQRLQQRALELLQEVDPINQGDLTVQIKVTPDEIGTLADSYNLIVMNLRRIVSQVQSAVEQVNSTATNNKATIRDLSQETSRWAAEMTIALEQVEQMEAAVQVVATNAEQAEFVVQQAAQTVKAGDAAMNRTIDGIQSIRTTVAEAAKKVKHLGESSQKISTVVDLISSFAAQTKTLALNASIEAALAGQEGRGFAVVAEEVRALARRSAEAANEIKNLVSSIQAETNEVVAAMEVGTEQVVVGTKLVDETRQSLNQISAVSAQISQLVEEIAQATLVQTRASQTVTQTMQEAATIAQQGSIETGQVLDAFEQLQQLAESLQTDVSQFKVS